MGKRLAALFAASLFSVLANGSASAAQPTPVPDVKPDLSGMSYFIGTWKCHEKVRGSDRSDRSDTSTYTPARDGRWVTFHDVAPSFDKYRTKTLVSDAWITYNPATKRWVDVLIDNFGDYGVATSPGWSGSTFVWTDTLSSDGTLGIYTITKISATKIGYLVVSHDKNGNVNPQSHAVCDKSS
jgi:hypothetical protein